MKLYPVEKEDVGATRESGEAKSTEGFLHSSQM